MRRLLASLGITVLLAGPAFARTEITGTSGDDVIHANQIHRGSQDIYALGGNDRVWGGKGQDNVFGGPGRDRLHGYHAGADTLYGGPGRDICVIGVTPGGHTNDVTISCKVKERDAQGHGG
jgi:Ca2+-binding RTX toxin-like protein